MQHSTEQEHWSSFFCKAGDNLGLLNKSGEKSLFGVQDY